MRPKRKAEIMPEMPEAANASPTTASLSPNRSRMISGSTIVVIPCARFPKVMLNPRPRSVGLRHADAPGSTSAQGTGHTSDAVARFAAIGTQVATLDGLVHGIAEASADQAQGLRALTEGVARVGNATQSTAAHAEECAAAAEELHGQATTTRAMVATFTLEAAAVETPETRRHREPWRASRAASRRAARPLIHVLRP